MNENRYMIEFEGHCKQKMDAMEKLFNSKIADMEKAVDVAKKSSDAAAGRISITNLIAIIAVVLSLVTLILHFK